MFDQKDRLFKLLVIADSETERHHRRDFNLFHAITTSEAIDILSTARPDVVLFSFDPFDSKDTENLTAVCTVSALYGIPVATTSEFNPDWLANLVQQSGAKKHFSAFPNLKQLEHLVLNSQPMEDIE